MKYEYWFANLKGIGDKRKRQIREYFPSAEKLYYIEETELKQYEISENEKQVILAGARDWDLEKVRALEKKEVQMVCYHDAAYPNRLRNISAPPYALYFKGRLPADSAKTVAIVGARDCSPYGSAMAREYATVLARAGVSVVSGMARGIDSVAQQGALEMGGSSYGVLGCGVDICYPREQIGLYMELQRQGGVLSEFPLGTAPLAQHFPARNRIISGLSDVVLVMEAKERSGSLITADMALEQGKDVYALPGPVDSLLSGGCNRLIKQGAGVLLEPEELLAELGISEAVSQEKSKQKNLVLETEENIVYSCLGFHPQNLEQLMERTKFPVEKLLDLLMCLEIRGLIREISKHYYVKST